MRAGLGGDQGGRQLPRGRDLRSARHRHRVAVVGDLIGEGSAQEHWVVGEKPNLAARLKALAAPIRWSLAKRRAGRSADCSTSQISARGLEGFVEPQRAWQVHRPSGVVSRFEALRRGTTPLIGREEEIDLLLRRWQQRRGRRPRRADFRRAGHRQVAADRALAEQIRTEPHTRLRYFCSPHHQNSALHPVIVQLERAAGFERDDRACGKLVDKSETLAGRQPRSATCPCSSSCCQCPVGDRFALLELRPQRKKERHLGGVDAAA